MIEGGNANAADNRRRPLAQPAGKASALIGLLGIPYLVVSLCPLLD